MEVNIKERPILFKPEMVRAILDWIKTQTRRLNGLGDVNLYPDEWKFGSFKHGYAVFQNKHEAHRRVVVKCPYGVVGDRLWVRETWFPYTGHGCYAKGVKAVEGNCFIGYKADMKDDFIATYRHSIHMSRWMSRINLEITNVRVERLQDIPEEDAKAEINGNGSWDKNPWVWVLTFKKLEENET